MKIKDREYKKMESELARTKEKVIVLEEKIQSIKADFKAKEVESKEGEAKKIAAVEEKVQDLRTRLKAKDDENNQEHNIIFWMLESRSNSVWDPASLHQEIFPRK